MPSFNPVAGGQRASYSFVELDACAMLSKPDPDPAGASSIDATTAGAVLTVDLGAIRANYRLLKKRLGRTACAAVVKADGYGLGAVPMAQALAEEGCDTFFVAHLSEGLALREGLGPDAVIYVLNGLPPGSEKACAAAGLRPVLNSVEQVRAWDALGRGGQPLEAAVQVDTGMSRLGLQPSDVIPLTEDARSLAGVRVSLVMSHLACADEPAHPANVAQLDAFRALKPWFGDGIYSLANSSGVFLGKDWHFDLARPGAALYGINPMPGQPNPMKPVVRLQAKVVQTRVVESGAGIGYAHRLVAGSTMRLATISLGYADGWHRSAAGAAFFDGARLPFAGRVSMDSIILDISALPDGRLKAGDLVDLFGPEQTVDDVAALAGTIGYEILTSLGQRFHRVYLDG